MGELSNAYFVPYFTFCIVEINMEDLIKINCLSLWYLVKLKVSNIGLRIAIESRNALITTV